MIDKVWIDILNDSNIFASDDEERIVNSSNIKDILKALEIDNFLKLNECLLLLTFYENNKAKFEVFYKDLVKLMDEGADQDTE